MKRIVVAAVLVSVLGGCAGYKLTPLTKGQAIDAWSRPDEGYIFYQPQPFLIGTLKSETPAGGGAAKYSYDFKIVYLPDHDRAYRFTRYEFLAKNDLKITFADGWQFTGAESHTDSTAALTAMVDVAKAGIAALSFPGTGGAPAVPPPVLLFRIKVTDAEVSLSPVTVPH